MVKANNGLVKMAQRTQASYQDIIQWNLIWIHGIHCCSGFQKELCSKIVVKGQKVVKIVV